MLRHVVAKRRYDLQTPAGQRQRHVTIELGRPIKEHIDYRCFYRIEGLGGQLVRYAAGIDAVQALLLAMVGAASYVYTSDEFKAGLISWNGDSNLGLPLIELDGDDVVPNPMMKLIV